VKTVFKLDASLRNYNKKMKEIRLDACMHACMRQLCQVMSGGTSRSKGGFYAATN
jgi:hypothetical protein